MTRLCRWFGHAYRVDRRLREHWQSNTTHYERWNVCKRCKYEHKLATDRVRHAEDVIRGRV